MVYEAGVSFCMICCVRVCMLHASHPCRLLGGESPWADRAQRIRSVTAAPTPHTHTLSVSAALFRSRMPSSLSSIREMNFFVSIPRELS